MLDRMDLWVAAAGMVAVGTGLAVAAYRASAGAPNWVRNVAFGVLTGLLLLFGLVLEDSVWLARLLPFRCLPVYGNLAIPLALPVGALLLRFPLPRWRAAVLSALLATTAVGAVVLPLMDRPPSCGDHWHGDVCMQTSMASCSAAAAATLLHHAGIEANEEEMARLCLTSAKGTTLHGLFRGLLAKTEGSPFRPHVVTATVDDLRVPGRLPAIVSVSLTPELDAKDDRYANDWGWQVGVTHAVVVLAFTDDGRVRMADPSVGEEYWRVEGLRGLMGGDCVWLEPR